MNLQGSIRIPRRPKDGEDGSSVEFGFRLSDTSSAPAKPTGTLPNASWTYTMPLMTTSNRYLWITKRTKAQGSSTWSAWDTPALHAYLPKDGEPGVGIPGLPGQIPIQKEWVVGDTHRNTDEIVDYIYVRGADKNTSFWYKLASKGTKRDVGAPPSGGTTPSGYERIDWLKELAVKVLIAEEANIAGFIFKDNRLISQKGRVNGIPADYNGQNNFIPNIVLDGVNGDVKLSGEVNATSGNLDSVTVTNADIKDATIDGLLKVSSGYQGSIGNYNLFWIAPMPAKILTVPTTYDSKGKSIKFYNASSTVSHTLNLLVIGYKLNSEGEVVLTNYTISDEAKGARKDSVFIPPRGSVEVSCFEIPPGNYKSTGGGSMVYDRVLSWEMTNREVYVAP